MHNSDSINSYSASFLTGWRFPTHELSAGFVECLPPGPSGPETPPNLKEAWSTNTVKRNLDRPTLIHFNHWLKEKAEAHERMEAASGKPIFEEVPVTTVTKTKTGTKVFAATSSNQVKAVTKVRSETQCVACKVGHLLGRCTVFRHKLRQREPS